MAPVLLKNMGAELVAVIFVKVVTVILLAIRSLRGGVIVRVVIVSALLMIKLLLVPPVIFTVP